MSTTHVDGRKAPRTPAGKAHYALEKSRAILAQKQALIDELTALRERLRQGESSYDALDRRVRSMTNEQENKRWLGRNDRDELEAELEALKAQLAAAGKALTPVYESVDELTGKIREQDNALRDIARDALVPALLELRQQEKEIAAVNELEAKLQAEKAAIESDCEPSDDQKLARLEKLQLRLSVLPGFRARQEEKFNALLPPVKEMWTGAKQVFAQMIGERQQAAHELFYETIRPLFDPKEFEALKDSFHLREIVRGSLEFNRTNAVIVDARANAHEGHFTLADAEALVGGFAALAALPPVPRVTPADIAKVETVPA